VVPWVHFGGVQPADGHSGRPQAKQKGVVASKGRDSRFRTFVTEKTWEQWLERLYRLRRDKRGSHERPHKPV